MKSVKLWSSLPTLSVIVLLTVVSGISYAPLQAADPVGGRTKSAAGEQVFASPDEAVSALKSAAETGDRPALEAIFGPQFQELLTGDKVQDANNARRFAAALAQGCERVKEGEDKIILEVGANTWPYPIPLVKADGQWHFDTAAGKEEIINRHIGKDELHAIGVCRAYVAAQRQYSAATPGVDGMVQYARKFKSTPGQKDGLYWPVTGNETASPFGPLVAEAHAEGYEAHKGAGPHPFHGYYFRILTRQGKDAPGGKQDYLTHGLMTGGFALVAYPEKWDQSGIMTFIVNQDGKVYQRNLGPKSARIAARLKEYNPDGDWTLVQDEGISRAASER